MIRSVVLLLRSVLAMLFLIAVLGGPSGFAEAPVPDTNPLKMTYFGNNQYPAQHQDAVVAQGVLVVVYNLDAPINLEKELALGLPADDVDKATRIAQARIAEIPQKSFVTLFTGVIQARQWHVERFPAVVFGNGDALLYGVTDLNEALELWREHRDQNAGSVGVQGVGL